MIDFHVHLDLYPEPSSVAKECNAQHIDVLSVTTTPSAWKGTSALTVPASQIRTALGLHPQIANQRVFELDLFDKYLPDTAFVGEIGLDGSPEFKRYWEDQLAVFDHILQSCTRAGGRIMSIHSRRATSAVLDRLEAFPNAGVPILHWFSGNKRDLERAISLEYWFSIGPTMLLAAKTRDMVSHMPCERILTETDGPFVRIGGRNVMPWDVHVVTTQLAEIWKIPVEDVDHKLCSNLRHLDSLVNV